MFRLFQDYGSEFECVLLCVYSDISKANYMRSLLLTIISYYSTKILLSNR